ncbi:putative Protein KIAA0415-like protein, partial [Naja naja]
IGGQTYQPDQQKDGGLAEFADETLAKKLTLAALERSDLLYEIPGFKAEVFR